MSFSIQKKIIPLMLIGNYKVGKTNLLKKYIKNQFSSNYSPTIGIELSEKNIEIDNNKINIKFYDSSGQERFKEVIKTYLTTSKGFILTYSIDDRKSFELIENWLNDMKINSNNSYDIPIIILGNKNDLNENIRKITYEEGKNLADKYGYNFYECSSKTGENVLTAFDNIIKQTYEIQRKLFDDSEINNKEEIDEINKKAIVNYIENIKKYFLCEDSVSNVIRCSKCLHIPLITINNKKQCVIIKCNNSLCPNNNIMKSYNFEKINKEFIYIDLECFICKKKFSNKLLYNSSIDYKSNKVYCKDCSKKENRCNEVKMLPFYLIDSFCLTHEKIKNRFCDDCHELMCDDCCIDQTHVTKAHKTNFILKNAVNCLLKEKKSFIKMEEDSQKELEDAFNDLIKSLNEIFLDFKKRKSIEIKIKKDIIKHFENITYNYSLFKNVKNLTFDDLSKPLNYDTNAPLDRKLVSIFEYMNIPLSANLSALSKELISFNKIDLLSEKNENWKEKGANGKKLCITDVCMINENYTALSLNNGFINIYNKNKNKKMSSFQLVEASECINSLVKFTKNNLYEDDNLLLASNFQKIYLLNFNENFTKYSILEEYNEEGTFFNNLVQYKDNHILYLTLSNEIIIFDFINKQKYNITKDIFTESDIGLLSLNKVKNDKYIYSIKYNEKIKKDNKEGFQYQSELKVIKLNGENKVDKRYTFQQNFELLGELNDEIILLIEKNNNIDFKNKLYIFIYETNELILEKDDVDNFIGYTVFSNQNNNLIYFLFMDGRFNINQFCYNKNTKLIDEVYFLPYKSYINEQNIFINPKNSIKYKLIYIDKKILFVFYIGYIIQINLS